MIAQGGPDGPALPCPAGSGRARVCSSPRPGQPCRSAAFPCFTGPSLGRVKSTKYRLRLLGQRSTCTDVQRITRWGRVPQIVPNYLLAIPIHMDGLLLSILHVAEAQDRSGAARALRIILAGQLLGQGSGAIPSPTTLRRELQELTTKG
jgi:hypothetical protein